MDEKVVKIGDGIEFVTIAEPKFKTNTIEMVFLMHGGRQTNSANALMEALLSLTNKKYASINAMSKKLGSMYGATLKGSTSKFGDYLELVLNMSVIDNHYAPNGEDLLAEVTDVIFDCMFRPNAENGAFSENVFRIEKQDLLDAIEAEINDKRAYATDRATEIAFEGEPYACSTDGKIEDVEKLTPESVYEAYERMLREAVVRVYHVGPKFVPEIGERLKEAFSGIERKPISLQLISPSPCKPEVLRVTEKMNVTQSKLVVVFKAEETKKYAMNLMNTMFGASPFSMLFMNVREKMSLCYYCSSRWIGTKRALFVSSGVELENAEKTHTAILEQLDLIRRGEFTDEMLENARRSLINSLHGVGDTPHSCIFWSHHKFCDVDSHDIPDMLEAYQKLTRQDVIDAANALREDTVYLMQQEEVQA